MKPLIVLLSVFVLSLFTGRLIQGGYDVPAAGRIAMSAMLLLTAIGHFRFTKGMTMMIPDAIPYKTAIVYSTGLLEVAAAICLLIPATQTVTAIFLVCFFIILLPANIYAAMHRINYEKGTVDGPGMNYLWFRIPLQVLFIVWIWFSTIA
jgi:uncharacterized membrane protein